MLKSDIDAKKSTVSFYINAINIAIDCYRNDMEYNGICNDIELLKMKIK
jgi:hypothetical protein